MKLANLSKLLNIIVNLYQIFLKSPNHFENSSQPLELNRKKDKKQKLHYQKKKFKPSRNLNNFSQATWYYVFQTIDSFLEYRQMRLMRESVQFYYKHIQKEIDP